MKRKKESAFKPDSYREEMLKVEHGLRGEGSGFTENLTLIIGLMWSLFQLASAGFILIDAIFVRAIHLTFAISLVYLNIPMLKQGKTGDWDKRILLAMNRVTVIDYIFAIFAAFSALYIILDYTGIASRAGLPITRDLIFGFLLIILLLEATRRVIGPALPTIATVFIVYVFSGPYLPDFLAFKGANISRFISQMTMDSEGIYGVPLQVSATVVFLFVLFGTMLERAGGGQFFIRLAIAGLGHFKGGAAKAAVLGSALTGMISGSSIANVVTTGTFTIPLMKKMGYPSAAAIPAFASYVALLWITHVEASKLGMQGLPKSALPNAKETLKEGWIFLIPICMLLYELIFAQHSAEMSVFRAICVLSVMMLGTSFIRNRLYGLSRFECAKLALKEWLLSLSAGATNMAGVALATACAGIIVGCISLGLGQQITTFVEILSMNNIILLLAITAIASLLLGMGLPTTANYIIMASLTAPILVRLASNVDIHGVDLAVPLLAAHLFCLYFGILADDTPPVGLAAYAGAAIAEASPITTGIQGFWYDIRTAILPLMFFFNHDIILWNIHSFPMGMFIFGMTCLGTVCFASFTQGWFVNKNNTLDKIILALCTVLFLNPFLITGFILPYEYRYAGSLVGMALMVFVYCTQKARPNTVKPLKMPKYESI